MNAPWPDACPSCRSIWFFEGPRGGLSVNVKCVKCGRKFNYMGPFGMDGIDNDDAGYSTKVVKLEDL